MKVIIIITKFFFHKKKIKHKNKQILIIPQKQNKTFLNKNIYLFL